MLVHPRVNFPVRKPIAYQKNSLLDRTKKVKDARAEAQKEIDDYREQKESEFKGFEKEVLCNLMTSQINLS
jgi:Vacuolar (H+)-ATPase G subunit